jgi:hypothetical protein
VGSSQWAPIAVGVVWALCEPWACVLVELVTAFLRLPRRLRALEGELHCALVQQPDRHLELLQVDLTRTVRVVCAHGGTPDDGRDIDTMEVGGVGSVKVWETTDGWTFGTGASLMGKGSGPDFDL